MMFLQSTRSIQIKYLTISLSKVSWLRIHWISNQFNAFIRMYIYSKPQADSEDGNAEFQTLWDDWKFELTTYRGCQPPQRKRWNTTGYPIGACDVHSPAHDWPPIASWRPRFHNNLIQISSPWRQTMLRLWANVRFLKLYVVLMLILYPSFRFGRPKICPQSSP